LLLQQFAYTIEEGIAGCQEGTDIAAKEFANWL
jgi:hypothetical protein